MDYQFAAWQGPSRWAPSHVFLVVLHLDDQGVERCFQFADNTLWVLFLVDAKFRDVVPHLAQFGRGHIGRLGVKEMWRQRGVTNEWPCKLRKISCASAEEIRRA